MGQAQIDARLGGRLRQRVTADLDRNLGGATFGPFRLPLSEAKKFR